MSVSVSTDIGGTFTDVVTVDEDSGEIVVGKSATVAGDPTEGIVAGLEGTGVGLSEASRFLHGTTIGINALLERKGASVGFLTTKGFRDVLTIGTGSWPPYRMTWDRPEPLVPRFRCREVNERIRSDGTVEQALNPKDVLDAVRTLLEAGAESIAVCLYNSYSQPVHEQMAGDVIREEYPDLVVVLSHELSRRYREVERGSTTVAEAYLRPKMRSYFHRLDAGLDEAGFEGPLFITSSDGGVMGVGQARNRALRTLVSGCASGVSGAASIAHSSGWSDLVAIDMGGTSFDAAVIRSGKPSLVQTADLAGLRFLIPMIDLATIGAGGGSIASVDSAGGLNVGPTSAGAVPGPACYARGGELPTFTDAALVSGLLPEKLLGGGMVLRKDLAEQAISTHVSDQLELSVSEAASGITAVVEARMAQTLEELTVGQGLDPRDFTIMAYGGGGPLVATRLAAEIGSGRAVVPVHPGVFSALGMQTLDVVHDFSRTWIEGLGETDPATIEGFFDQLCTEAKSMLEAESVPHELIQLHRSVEMRYDGQEHALLVPFSEAESSVVEHLAKTFDRTHRETFGFAIDGEVEIVGFQVRAIGQLPKADFSSGTRVGADASAALTGFREVYDRLAGPSNWPIYRRDLLEPGNRLEGPAVVEELTATTVVSPGFNLEVHPEGHLVLTNEGTDS